ncbi:MAG: fumarate reductase (quinol) flavoprotein subunit [Phycisphaera sp.]|nr:fumarate reductase (quinol) flavoprotein subunit [Phycisphaera sp.]
MSDFIQHDVVIIGGGGAGLRAAISLAESGLSIALVSKVYPMRSHTVAAEGGAAAVIKPNDSLEDHIYDTISGADWLADQDAVEYFVNEAPKEMTRLEHWGCPWSREPQGKVAVRPFGGMKIERTWFAADKTGFHMLHSLFQNTLRYPQLKRYDEHFATKLLVDNGRCCGCVAVELKTGKVKTIAGKAVIMATGGAGKIFPFTTNGAIKTGDGMSLAYRAGVPLKDMEFVQYHPTGLPGTGILITEASRGEGGILVNNEGYRYLQDYDLGKPQPVDSPAHPVKRTMELGPRDRLSQAFYWEREKGRTIKLPAWNNIDVVMLDLRHLGEAKIDKKIPFVRELSKNYVGIDPVTDMIPVRPVIHYMMGGIDTDINAATTLPGLYAAGECACVSINGANRLGSNSLTELLVFGGKAGDNAAEFAKSAKDLNVAALTQQGNEEEARVKALMNDDGTESIADIRTAMQSSMEDGAGIYRTESSMKATAEVIAEQKERYKKVQVKDHSGAYNTQLQYAFELGCMLDVAEALVHSANARTESRGAHQRLEYKERDDDKFLAHSMAHFNADGGAPKIDYKDVVITKWPPGARTYGKDSGLKRK